MKFITIHPWALFALLFALAISLGGYAGGFFDADKAEYAPVAVTTKRATTASTKTVEKPQDGYAVRGSSKIKIGASYHENEMPQELFDQINLAQEKQNKKDAGK